MSALKNLRIARILLFLIGIIAAFICWFNGNPAPKVSLYWLLPLSFGVLHLLIDKIYKYEAGMGLLIFEIIAFLRYVLTPIVTCIVHDYDGHTWTTSDIYSEAVGYMIIELCVAYLVMYFLIPYVRRKTRFEALPLEKTRLENFGIIKAGIVFIFVLVLIVNPPIRDMLFNVNITSEAVSSITYTMAEYRSQIPGEYLIFYYLGLVVIYVQLLKLIKENKSLPKWISIFFIIIASLTYASCGWSNGKSVSRWSILVSVLVMVYILLYFFPEKRKIIAIGGTAVVIFAVLLGTFYKRISHGMSLTFWEAFETYLTPSALNEYFTGVYPVGNGINTVLHCSNDRISTFLYDTVANIPKFLSTFKITGESTASFFGQYTNHTELIIPNIAMSYYVFGFIGSFVYTAILTWLMIVTQVKMQISPSLYTKLMLFQIMFWCSLSMAVNIQIIQANCWKYVIGLILVTIDEKITIKPNWR